MSETEQPARVTLRRDDPSDVQQRQVLARIDNGAESTLLFGERVTIEVPPGAHELRANNTLVWKKIPFSIAPGEHVEFQLVNHAGRLAMTMLGILGVAPLRLTVEKRVRGAG